MKVTKVTAAPAKYGVRYRNALRMARATREDEQEWVDYERLHAYLPSTIAGESEEQTLDIARRLARAGELEMHRDRQQFRTLL